jgi:hypothetical protein
VSSRTPILVCSSVSNFADDCAASCSVCGTAIVHRPHVPAGAVKMCEGCAAKTLAADTEPWTIAVTDATMREILLHRAKTRGEH